MLVPDLLRSFILDECSFETALKRAVAHAQEGLSPEAAISVYQTIYFPAQAYHFRQDQPQAAATAYTKTIKL